MVDRGEAERGVGQHREERHDPGTGQHRQGLRQIDQQQRRDGDDRCHLQDHRVRIERVFDQPRLAEQDGKADAADGGEQEALEGGGERHQQRLPQQAAVGDQCAQHQARARQHKRRNGEGAHHQVPGHQHQRQHEDGQADAQRAVAHGAPPIALPSVSAT